QEPQTPQELIENAISELKSVLIDKLLTEINNMNPYDFERLVVDLLLKMGYGSPEQNQDAVTKKSGDEGLDGIVKADRFGFDAVYTQAKKWKEDSFVGRPEIQKFLGAVAGQGATKGLYITTGQFTKEAKDFAARQLNHKIILIDGKQLAELMIEYDLGVTTVKTYPIKRIDSDYFDADN
ncbi:MAG: restriction endonuclease, partial [Synergistaceae bacterium]|nr:restriction endonuclease [Synergistaceae bacterium]